MRIACPELPGWFAQTATIVTPSPFLAAVSREQFDRHQLKKGLETWERLPIHSFDAWLVSCWHEVRYTLADTPSLLSPAQERALWHDVIEQEHPNLFDLSATVRLARTASKLIADWQISPQGEAWNEHTDALQFQRWYRAFQKKCRDNHWITRAELPRVVAGWLTSRHLRAQLTAFVGFDNAPLSVEGVLNAMGASAVRLPFEHPRLVKKVPSKSFQALQGELEFAARRLRYQFEENPNRSFALLVPELGKQSALVERTLTSVFFPSTATKMADIGESPFHISEARLLIDQPIVASALLLLNLLCPRIDQADVGAMLRSPFIRGAHAEQNERALADIALRKQRELDFNFRDIERVSRSSPILSACFHSMAKLLPKTSQRRPLSDWSEFVSEVLLALGWPGERELTPSEDSLAERWKDQLSELSSLGLVSAPVSFESAVAHLRRLLSVPVESGDMISPIQVLDASLAGGVEFDSAIAVGLSEETWPPPSRISPLVPLKLQRHNQVPMNSADERARRTHAIFEASSDLFVTFSDRLTSVAQPFIARKGREIPIWQGLLPIDSFKPETLDQQRDGQAPVFAAQGNVRGGTGVIKAQSQCPFQAFAKYRLHARRPEDASFGFDALDRGSFVHKSLEFVWKRLQSLQNLRQMPAAELKELVRESIEEAVTTKEAGPLHELSVVTERERLQEVILDWLEVERVRDQDFVVETIEEEQKFEVPGLSLTVRLDRIDRLRNGNLVLIDYKSGKQTRPKLAGERPAEPQLLVYAASVGSPVDGVFFGQLKPRDVKAVGYSRVKHFKDRTAEVKKDWNDYIDASRENVQKLAVEFVSGVAEVRPHNSPCEYCGMKPFCRVNEKGVGQEDEE